MGVVAVRSEPACKICCSESRADIDDLLHKRATKGQGADGRVVTYTTVLKKMADVGIANPTRENATTHWKKHCAVVAGAGGETEQEFEDKIASLLGEDWRGKPIQVHDFLPLLADELARDIIHKRKHGQTAGPQVEQFLKVAAEMNRRKSDGAIGGLLGMLAEASAQDGDEEQEPEAEPEEEQEGVLIA